MCYNMFAGDFMEEIRMPKQKRAILKRNHIIESGFKLICENGYYNTNTALIAKDAGVSTGIVYQYFKDKKEIFIEGIKMYADNILFPMLDILNNNEMHSQNFNDIVSKLLDLFIDRHNLTKKAHEELISMSHADPDIAEMLHSKEIECTLKIAEILKNNSHNQNNLKERVHIAVSIGESYCHEVVYHKHEEINYNVMKEEVINLITNLLK